MDFLTRVILFISCITVSIANDLSRGWNDDVAWVTLEDGIKAAKEQNKPMMLVIHKTWCGACKSLKPQFDSSKEIAELSKPFVMVNVLDDEEPEGEKYSPDGGYIPRVLFYDPDGNILDQYKNENGHPDYKYYHFNPTSIAATMKKVIKERNLEKPAGNEEL
ncbi:thioredoxin domain-containing protein 12-like [Mytilus trossulus]|uniref:thioredoxin domain-containing protein 12-like n=1 Tax=Mytilus trossulus TaxID=6551 RepID=UPI0030078E58